jgi:hypothetical protein
VNPKSLAILDRYNAGENTVAIAAAYGVSRQRVEQIAREAGAPRRAPEKNPKPGEKTKRSLTGAREAADPRNNIDKVQAAHREASPWSNERVVTRLREMAAQGLLNPAIAKFLAIEFPQYAFTSSSVIGIRHRLGMGLNDEALSAARSAGGRKGAERTAELRWGAKLVTRSNIVRPAKAKGQPANNIDRNKIKAAAAKAQTATTRPAPAYTGAVDILDLKNHHCRWPLGNGPFVFCGHAKADGSSYCPEHKRQAYVGLPPVRKHRRAA